jgi:hypothetical protein
MTLLRQHFRLFSQERETTATNQGTIAYLETVSLRVPGKGNSGSFLQPNPSNRRADSAYEFPVGDSTVSRQQGK